MLWRRFSKPDGEYMKIPKQTTNSQNAKLQKRNYTLRVYTDQGVQRYETSSIRRFLTHVRSISWQNTPIKVYLRVFYGKFRDHQGILQNFYNDGNYIDQEEFEKALAAFLEE